MAQKFSAGLDYRTGPNAQQQHTRIEVNHPLSIDGSKVYLIGHGYAPNVTVRDGNGKIAFSGPVVFTDELGVPVKVTEKERIAEQKRVRQWYDTNCR